MCSDVFEGTGAQGGVTFATQVINAYRFLVVPIFHPLAPDLALDVLPRRFKIG
jgi:hypothetical protein